MNTNPDETQIALWLDDELNGAELAEMDAWAASHPEQLAAREELRTFRAMLAQNIAGSEEPPYPDFFLSRINQGILDLEQSAPAKPSKRSFYWKSWFMPIAACAGMMITFYIGQQTGGTKPTSVKNTAPTMIAPIVYTPEKGVQAQWIPAPDHSSSVILLKGIAAIPDSTDFYETVYVPTERESDRTAQHDQPSSQTSTQ
jgi:hypothetical protein